MTTLATDGKSLAGDGRCTAGDLIHSETVKKVHRLNDGRIVGCCGSLYNIEAFVEWMNGGTDKPDLSDNFEALVIGPDGCVTYDEKLRTAFQSVPAATGSGAAVALGAMEAGAAPKRAVEIACKRDTGSGGEITVLHLEESP